MQTAFLRGVDVARQLRLEYDCGRTVRCTNRSELVRRRQGPPPALLHETIAWRRAVSGRSETCWPLFFRTFGRLRKILASVIAAKILPKTDGSPSGRVFQRR